MRGGKTVGEPLSGFRGEQRPLDSDPWVSERGESGDRSVVVEKLAVIAGGGHCQDIRVPGIQGDRCFERSVAELALETTGGGRGENKLCEALRPSVLPELSEDHCVGALESPFSGTGVRGTIEIMFGQAGALSAVARDDVARRGAVIVMVVPEAEFGDGARLVSCDLEREPDEAAEIVAEVVFPIVEDERMTGPGPCFFAGTAGIALIVQAEEGISQLAGFFPSGGSDAFRGKKIMLLERVIFEIIEAQAIG
jgi:hypothetical protein